MNLQTDINTFIESLPEISMKKHFYIWGTGHTASLYQEGFSREEKLNIFGYVDNDKEKWNSNFFGYKVFSPYEISMDKEATVLICSPQPKVVAAISKQVKEMGIPYYHIDEIIWGLHKKEIKTFFEWLEDDKSRITLLEVMRSRTLGLYPNPDIVSENPYAPSSEFTELNPNEIFVDCGSFVGDTMERFIWQRSGVFKKIIMFEPDDNNIKAMKYRIERLKREWALEDSSLQIFPYAVSDRQTIAIIENNPHKNNLGTCIILNREISKEDEIIKTVSIDEIIEEPITYLKADIESFEYRMLLGAEKTIKKYKPKLGICIYHNAVDLYSIPHLIKKYNYDYKFMIRHYSFQSSETVLYAW